MTQGGVGMQNPARKLGGYTLLELLVTVSISGIFASIAIPSLSELRAQTSHKALKDETLIFLKSSRGDAANLNTNVKICTLSEQKCDGLSTPWVAFTDQNNNNRLDSNETVLRQHSLNVNSVQWRKNRKSIRFMANGQARGYNGTLNICTKANKLFQIVVANTGRLRFGETKEDC